MKGKFGSYIWGYIAAILFISYIGVGIHLELWNYLVPGKDAAGLLFYLVWGFIFWLVFYYSVFYCKGGNILKYYIVEVERWNKDKYIPIYFVEHSYEEYFFIFNFLYKKKIKTTSTDYSSDNLFQQFHDTQEEAMKEIMNDIQKIVKFSKKQKQQLVKSVKVVKELDVQTLINQVSAD